MSFLMPKAPKVEAPPQVPQPDEARVAATKRAGMAGRRGRGANILAGSSESPYAGGGGTATKILTGQ